MLSIDNVLIFTMVFFGFLALVYFRTGEYHAIGYNLQGISQQQLEKTKTTLENAKAKLEKFQATKDQVALQGLTKHDITGAMIQAGGTKLLCH